MIVIATAAPGPNLLVVLNARLQRGYMGVRATIAGNLTANALITLIAILGSGAIIEAGGTPLRIAYTIAGGGYLIYLGARALSGAAQSASTLQHAARLTTDPERLTAAFKTAFATTMTNPKVLIFQSVVLPQFLSFNRPILLQYLTMMATIATSVTIIHFAYALAAGAALRIFANQRQCAFIFQIVSGGTFCVLGCLTLSSLFQIFSR